MREFEIFRNGARYTFLLSDEDAERFDATPVAEPAPKVDAPKPGPVSNKARTTKSEA